MTRTIERPTTDLDKLAQDLSAVSNLQRLRLLHLLTEPQYRTEVAEELDMSRQSVSKHVDRLETRGFVRSLQGIRDSGPVTEYEVVPQRLFALGMRIADLGRLEPARGTTSGSRPATMMFEDTDRPEAADAVPGAGGSQLLVVGGPEGGERFPLEGDGPRWTLGREEGRDIRLDHDPYISGCHAEIQRDPQGFAVVDVFSSNGTYLNYARLPQGGRAVLEPGDVIQVGRTALVFQPR